MRLEGGQLFGPKLLGPLQLGFQMSHWLRPQSVDANAGVGRGMGFLDQAAGLERPQMPAERRRVEPDGLRQLARPPWPFPQNLDDVAAMGIGECRQGPVEIDGRSQFQPSIFNPLAFSASSRETTRTVCPKLQTWPSGSRAR